MEELTDKSLINRMYHDFQQFKEDNVWINHTALWQKWIRL